MTPIDLFLSAGYAQVSVSMNVTQMVADYLEGDSVTERSVDINSVLPAYSTDANSIKKPIDRWWLIVSAIIIAACFSTTTEWENVVFGARTKVVQLQTRKTWSTVAIG